MSQYILIFKPRRNYAVFHSVVAVVEAKSAADAKRQFSEQINENKESHTVQVTPLITGKYYYT